MVRTAKVPVRIEIPNVNGHGVVIPGDRIRIGSIPTDFWAPDHEPESAAP